MKKVIVLVILISIFGVAKVNANALKFELIMCVMDAGALEEDVDALAKKWQHAKRTKTKGDRHRKHINRHIKKAINALREAEEQESCEPKRRTKIRQLRVELESAY